MASLSTCHLKLVVLDDNLVSLSDYFTKSKRHILPQSILDRFMFSCNEPETRCDQNEIKEALLIINTAKPRADLRVFGSWPMSLKIEGL